MPELQVAIRYLVFAAFAASVLVALASWLVRTRRVSPFGALGRTLRTASEPLIRPIETRLVRAGGNPVHAGWWLVVAVAAAGVLLVTLWNWLMETAFGVAAAYTAGPRVMIALAIDFVYRILVVAIWVRVLGAWFGQFRYSRWVRPAYVLTDWVVEPIRRVLPPAGGWDWSPLAAWLALWVLKRVLLTIGVGCRRPGRERRDHQTIRPPRRDAQLREGEVRPRENRRYRRRARQLRAGMEVVQPRRPHGRNQELSGRARGARRLGAVPRGHGRRQGILARTRRPVPHRAGARQLGRGYRAVRVAAFLGCRQVR